MDLVAKDAMGVGVGFLLAAKSAKGWGGMKWVERDEIVDMVKFADEITQALGKWRFQQSSFFLITRKKFRLNRRGPPKKAYSDSVMGRA